MALLNQQGKYIKMELDGHFTMYNSTQYRLQEKYSTSSEYVAQKYEDLLERLNQSNDTLTWQALNNEYSYYKQDVEFAKGARHGYPLMEQYCADVSLSVPNYTDRGIINVAHCKDIHEVYEYIKKEKFFGPVRDI